MPWIILTLSPSFFLSLTHTLSSVSVLIDSFITLILLILLFLLNPLGYSIKGAVRDSGPTRFFCQIQQIALHGPLALCSNIVAPTEPQTIPANQEDGKREDRKGEERWEEEGRGEERRGEDRRGVPGL